MCCTVAEIGRDHILKNCRALIPKNGTLLIIEFLLPPVVSRADVHLEAKLMTDLNMLAPYGRQRAQGAGVERTAGFLEV